MRPTTLLHISILLTVITSSCVMFEPVSSASSNLIVTPRNTGPTDYHLSPVTGPQQTLVILVDFEDVKHSENDSVIDELIFGQMAHYYDDVSYGQMHVVGKSVGWYTLSKSMAYYGADVDPYQPGNDARKLELIKDAIDAVPDSVNFNNYSRIMIVHAGIGQEDSPKESNLIWSDAYYGELSITTRTGVTINSLAIAPEKEYDSHSPLGVYTHEYGHLLGLPDLYDASLQSNTSDDFVGRWSLMGTGLWLGVPNGTSPAGLEAWSRIKLGWLVPDTLELTPGNPSFYYEVLHPLETPDGIRAIKIPFSKIEYYLIEFRSRIDYDEHLPGEGVLITRVDETKGTGSGIVRVIDANASSPTLNDAAYGIGGIFNDSRTGVFIDILDRNSTTYSILVGNQSPSSLPLTRTTVTGSQSVNTTYSKPTEFSAKLTDTTDHPLPGMTVSFQYYDNETWTDFALGTTDGNGNARFSETLILKPGRYQIRYIFTGASLETQYLIGSEQLAILDIRKLATSLHLQVPQVIEAAGATTLILEISDEFGRPATNVRVQLKVDGQSIKKVDVNGTAAIQISFGLHQLGRHIIQAEADSNDFYDGSSSSAELNVVTPTWFYGLVVIVVTVSLAAAYLVIRKRKRTN